MRVRSPWCPPAVAARLRASAGCTGDGPEPATAAAHAAASPRPAAVGPPSLPRDGGTRPREQARLAQAYPAALRPTVESVYDQVQPMLDAFDAFDRPRRENAQVRDDVFAAGGARLALEARLRELRAAEAPRRSRRRVPRARRRARPAWARPRACCPAATRATPGAGRHRAAVPAGRAGGGRRRRRLGEARSPPSTAARTSRSPRAATAPACARPAARARWLLAAGQACGRAGRARVAAAAAAACRRCRSATRRGSRPRC